jgi:hypothetical protein
MPRPSPDQAIHFLERRRLAPDSEIWQLCQTAANLPMLDSGGFNTVILPGFL